MSDEQIASLRGAHYIMRNINTSAIINHMILINVFENEYDIFCNKTFVFIQDMITENSITTKQKRWTMKFFKPMMEQPGIWHKNIFHDDPRVVDENEYCLILS